jgi:hypothetical protein
MPSPPRVRCRQIKSADIDGVVNLLVSGFTRSRSFWEHALRRLSEHPTPQGLPQYGYLLENEGTPVGVILLIFSTLPLQKPGGIRCNVSSWYVKPEFRGFATMLISTALRHKGVTYFNITPEPRTWPILEAQGYKQYCSGTFVAFPAISALSRGRRVSVVGPDIRPDQDLQSSEIELLAAHAKYGAYSLVGSLAGRRHPFVLGPRRFRGRVLYAQLIYCRDVEDFVCFAGPLGRFLARRGIPLVTVDSNGPIPGLKGFYVPNRPKFYRGTNPPRLGDLAYSERAMFNF